MSQFLITNESTKDTFATAEDLGDAVRIAREVARQGPAGDPVSVEDEGKTIRQLVLLPDGTVEEQAVAR